MSAEAAQPAVTRVASLTLARLKPRHIAMLASACGALLACQRYARQSPSSSDVTRTEQGPQSADRQEKVAVDMKFFRRLIRILRVILPSPYCREARCLLLLTVLMVCRTVLSVTVARILGRNGQNLVTRRWAKFFEGVFMFMLVTIPAAIVNSSLKYFHSLLSMYFRITLSSYVNEEYISGVNFYKAVKLAGNSQMENPDQRVTSDIAKFSTEITQCYIDIIRPLLDVMLFTSQVIQLLGWPAAGIMFGYFISSALVKKLVIPSFGKFVAKESELEGQYRSSHLRLLTNAEEVAFYDGAKKERHLIHSALISIHEHVNNWRFRKAWTNIFDSLIVKYLSTIAGYMAVASPYIFNVPHVIHKSSEEIAGDYIANIQYLMGLQSSVSQLVLTGNRLVVIAGYASRVSELLEMVKHLNSVGNKPFQAVAAPQDEYFTPSDKTLTVDWLKSWRSRCEGQNELRLKLRHDPDRDSCVSMSSGGTIEVREYIQFNNCDIVAPDGQLLVKNLCVKIPPGCNTMITGPNGSGKSSLFRVIGELWPLHNGVLSKPRRENVLFVPQRAYFVKGTLRDQLIYPHFQRDMETLAVTDADLIHLLSAVDPKGSIVASWSLDTISDWNTTLSGGQKQRVAMARLFYHCPKFAILDECTSAVSAEVEDAIYETCLALGITLFTVSHRPSLQRHHQCSLHLDGRGGWQFQRITG